MLTLTNLTVIRDGIGKKLDIHDAGFWMLDAGR
jgi:hypothetical protein